MSKRGPTTVIFDIGAVLYDWDPRLLYERLIPPGEALEVFLRDIVTREWHFQHDEGRSFAETSAELTALHPQHARLIAAWGERFLDSIPGPMPDMPALVDELHAAAVPLYAITNFSGEFFPAFRAREAAMFDRFHGIVVSGDEKMVKPHAPIYRLALARFGVRADDVVFVDDNYANVAGARAVGMTALHFSDAAILRAELVTLGLLPPVSRLSSDAPAPSR